MGFNSLVCFGRSIEEKTTPKAIILANIKTDFKSYPIFRSWLVIGKTYAPIHKFKRNFALKTLDRQLSGTYLTKIVSVI